MHRLTGLISIVAATGCVADSGDEGFVVRNNLAAAQGCTFDADVDSPFLPRGTIALNSPTPYLFNPLVESRITAATGQESQRTVQLRGARVDLDVGPIVIENGNAVETIAFGASEIAELQASGAFRFRSLFAAPLTPNGGLVSTGFDLIPTSALAAIRAKVGALPAGARINAQIVATATLYGKLGDSEVDGLPYTYPVTVCSDCVTLSVGACSALPMGYSPTNKGSSCNPYQDGLVDCCTTATGLVCPAARPPS